MSYDISLFLPMPGLSPKEELAFGYDEERPALDRDACARAIARLQAIDPALENDGSDDDGFFLLDEETGLQIELYDRSGGISFPYWHDGAEAERLFTRVNRYLEILHGELGVLIHDPQLDRMIDPVTGYLPQDIGGYTDMTARVQSGTLGNIMQGDEKSAARPWWKFW